MNIVIDRKIRELEKSIDQLKKIQKYSFNEIEDDLEKFWAIEHGLQISIQMIIDIGNNIIAEVGENEIEGYSDVLDRLVKYNILPIEFADGIRGMIGFRNLLVHRYGEVDVKIVYDILQSKLYDFERFIGYIQSYLESK